MWVSFQRIIELFTHKFVLSSQKSVADSVADADPGFGDFVIPGSVIGFFGIPDLRSRVQGPKPYF
jgi:hypothetical protein